MPDITLIAETGRAEGTRPSRRLRAAGRIPAVLYGRGGAPVVLSIDRRELRVALATDAGANALLRLEVDGQRELAMVKTMQRHPVRRNVTHVDFVRVDVHDSVEVEVPIHLEGEATAVLRVNGIVDAALNSLTVLAKPDNIPSAIIVDISAMQIGDIIRVGDLTLPEGATTPLDPDTTVVTAETTLDISDEPAPEGEPSAETPTEGE